ncbi:FAD-binding oxidoreductase [Polyangium jinanense]|uniref:FAD-binding oxidoreductase n=1 Tax=Polyangium jinanense TaxID=2829994 RepID=A0A9X4AXL3_9BACT|nr:FAD-binding oxidoreductase [Polyangium jinanense]MDC3958985.1 FAD-binding oxidoreductase [Polyangium jinanense]MDC3986390.1 FAD-binding oxidoreductase [Polyangium jinanense]
MHQDRARFPQAALDSLRTSFRGELIDPDHGRYDAARVVWNARIDKRPALIARCAGVADVLAAVRFAREHDARVAVRGGGHDIAGNGVCDGGIVIDLSPMKGVRVDPARRTVRAQAGLTWRELDHETQAFGLATTGGQCSATGIAGVTLGGGIGWLMRQHGLTIDNLLSVDLVTADGRLVTASADENADLFWGLRGGGGNFGIVTELELRLHPVEQVMVAMLFHPVERFADVLRFYQTFARTEPERMSSTLIQIALPPMPTLPARMHGVPGVILAACYNGPSADAEAAFAPLRAFGPPAAELVSPMPYTVLQSMFDTAPAGAYGYGQCIRGHYVSTLGDDGIEAIAAQLRAAPSPLCLFEIAHLEGAIARVGEDETAFPRRKTPFFSMFQSSFQDPADAERHIRWTQDAWQAMKPFAAEGVYVNFIDAGEPAARVQETYGEAKMKRLAALKRAYDPTNFFRLNKNIAP